MTITVKTTESHDRCTIVLSYDDGAKITLAGTRYRDSVKLAAPKSDIEEFVDWFNTPAVTKQATAVMDHIRDISWGDAMRAVNGKKFATFNAFAKCVKAAKHTK